MKIINSLTEAILRNESFDLKYILLREDVVIRIEVPVSHLVRWPRIHEGLRLGSQLMYALSRFVYISHIMHQGQHPIPKSYPWYLWLNIKRPAGPWFLKSGKALQLCLKKQIAGMVTLLIQTRWHGPIHLCLLFDVLVWAEHRDGLFHWHLVWWIKHQCGFGIGFLNTRAEMLMDHRTMSVPLCEKCFKDSQLF